jgi:hypothetical protein
MEEQTSAQAKKSPVASIATLVVFLFIGAGIGFLIKSCPAANCDLVTENGLTEDAETTTDTENPQAQSTAEQTNIEYKTFSEPDVYFTFEYPAAWSYEKQQTAPGEEYNETYYIFYADADKKKETLQLYYPMYETAMDTCLKFEEVTDYIHKHIATNDPGTFINYVTCGATEYDQEESYLNGYTMGDIFWQRGVWDGDKAITSDEKTQVRIHWNNNLITPEIANHIAYSVKIN